MRCLSKAVEQKRLNKQVAGIKGERDVTVMIDGKPIGILPATFEVISNALRVRM